MMKEEAIEAGELAKALEACQDAIASVKGIHGCYPLTLLMLSVFDGDKGGGTGVGADVSVRPWLIIASLQTLCGMIVQRLAALGVDTSDGQEASGG